MNNEYEILRKFNILNYEKLKKDDKAYIEQLLIRHNLWSVLSHGFGLFYKDIEENLRKIFIDMILRDPALQYKEENLRPIIKLYANQENGYLYDRYNQAIRGVIDDKKFLSYYPSEPNAVRIITGNKIRELDEADGIFLLVSPTYSLDQILTETQKILKKYGKENKFWGKNDGILSEAELASLKTNGFLAYVDLQLIMKMAEIDLSNTEIRECLFRQQEKTTKDIDRNEVMVRQGLFQKYKKFKAMSYRYVLTRALQGGLKKGQIKKKKTPLAKTKTRIVNDEA